jgi:hypothetical protein
MNKRLSVTGLLLTAIISTSSCTTPINQQPMLRLPPELVIPQELRISADELQCLSDETVSKLIKRDMIKDARIETLKGIIRATQ